jgi:hypothetical protein
MPLYEFEDKETGKIVVEVMKIADKPQFLVDHPNLKSIISAAPAICDSVRIGVKKVDVGFKEVLNRIHQRTPGSTLNKVADL